MRHYPRSILASLVILVAWFTSSVAIEYFPSKEGPVFNYTYGPVIIIEDYGGVFYRSYCYECFATSANGYEIGAEGDVYWVSYGSSCQQCPDPDIFFFEPNILYLDFPLDTGKSWSCSVVETGLWGPGDGVAANFEANVRGPETVSVPAGEFDVIVVSWSLKYENAYLDRTGELWLHRQLGPINDLVSWEGIVDTESRSWGGVKALYR